MQDEDPTSDSELEEEEEDEEDDKPARKRVKISSPGALPSLLYAWQIYEYFRGEYFRGGRSLH